MRPLIVIILAGVCLVGCGKPKAKPTPKKPAPKPQPSLTQSMIDGATGRTAVKDGRKAKKKIEEAYQKRNNDFDEVFQ